jgi:hypothetical protein
LFILNLLDSLQNVLFFIQWLQWHPVANVLLLGTVDGDVWMWKIPSGDCKTFQGPGCTATSGRVLPDGMICQLELLIYAYSH